MKHILFIFTTFSSFCCFLHPWTKFVAFKCEEPNCGKRFTRRDNLLQHQRCHRTSSDAQNISWDNKPGPLERVHHTHDPPSAARSSMGVLLPSPLTTNPMPIPSPPPQASGSSAIPSETPTPSQSEVTISQVPNTAPAPPPEIQHLTHVHAPSPPSIHTSHNNHVNHAHHSHSHSLPFQEYHPPPIHHLHEISQPNYLPCFHGDTHSHVRSTGVEPRFVHVTVPVGDMSYHWTALQQGR